MQDTPIVFEPTPSSNLSSGEMLGRVPGTTLRFSPQYFEINLPQASHDDLRITFRGSYGHARVHGLDRMRSETNYLIGSDAASWRTHVPNFGRLAYTGLYPGIDAVFYGNARQLEHDFIVAPGADYSQIRMHFPSRAHAAIGEDGDLRIALPQGELIFHKPVIYQDSDNGRTPIHGSFLKLHNGDIGFSVGLYDHSRALVIDPVLSFSTYLANVISESNFVATDAAGATYVAGIGTLGYPVTPGAFAGCTHCSPNEIITYVSKFSADGKALLYSTLLGGSAYTQPFGLAIDANGDALVAGRSQSTDFPTKNGQPLGTNGNGSEYAFLTSLSPDGSRLNFSTLLGGGSQPYQSSWTDAFAVAADGTGNVYVTGTTDAPAFPVTPGALHAVTPAYPLTTVFLSKFGPSGTLIYSGIVGDTAPQNGGGGPIGVSKMAVDSTGNAYITGQAGSLWPITSGAYQPEIGGAQPYAAPFVTKVAPDGASLIYSTFLGTAWENTGIALLPNGNVWLTGVLPSPDFPITAGAFQASPGGSYLSELNSTGSNLLYSTFFGGTGTQTYGGVAVDVNGDVWIAGQTSNAQLPLVKPLQSAFPRWQSGSPATASFVAQFDPTGATLKFSSFLGGQAIGSAFGIALDPGHKAHVAGMAEPGMYTTSDAYLAEVPPPTPTIGALYGYAALIDPSQDAPALCIPYSQNAGLFWGDVAAGATLDRPLTLTSCGTQSLTISSIETSSGAFSVPADKDQCPQSLPVGQSCTVALRFAPSAKQNYSSTVTVVSNAPVTEAVLPLTGAGVIPQLAVVNFPVFDFALVGQTTRPANLFLQNTGGATVTFDYTKTMVTGDFAVSSTQSCGQSLAPGDTCVLQLAFKPTAPGTRTGTLQIASNDPANPITSASLAGTGYSAAPAPQITFVDNPTIAAGSTGVSLHVVGFGFLPSSVVQVNGKPQQTTYNNSTFLTAALDSTAIPASGYGEIPVTVVTPAPGGGQSNSYTITIYQRIFTQNAGMLYEPTRKKLYISVPASATSHANTILPIDPATATLGTPIPVGTGPGVLAASADGQYLYVGLNGAHEIQRIKLSSGTVERTFPLPTDPSFGALTVTDMHVVPGTPTSVVATFGANVSPPQDGIALFNDSGLVNYIPGQFVQNGANTLLWLDNFAFTSDPSTIYGMPFDELSNPPFFTLVKLDGSGLHYTKPGGPYGGSPNSGSLVVSDGTLLYTNNGQVWNPSAKKLLHTYPLSSTSISSVVPDSSSGKTYFLDQFSQYDRYTAMAIHSFDQSTLAETGVLSFAQDPQSSFPLSSTQLFRWGTSGFAFRFSDNTEQTSNDSIVMLTSNIATSSNLNPKPVATSINPSSVVAAGPDFTLTVRGSGFVSGSTIEWNGTPRITTYVSATKLTAIIYASDVATAGTAQITVISPGHGGGESAGLPFTITTTSSASQLTLAPTALTFVAQDVGTTSAAQTVTLKNVGQVDVAGIAITLTGNGASSFTQSSTCASTLAAGASCQVSVVFAPQSAGVESASLSIASNATGSPMTVALSGTAVATSAFTVTPSSGGSSSSTINVGQTANYTLAVTPAPGYSGKLTLSCGNLPTHASCVFSPATLSITNGKPASFTVAVSTSEPQSSAFMLLLHRTASLLGFALLPWWWRKRRYIIARGAYGLVMLVMISAVAVGCGGNSSSQPSPPTTAATVAPGTYTIQVIASDGTNTARQPLTLIVQ